MSGPDLIRQRIDSLLKDAREQHDRTLAALADAVAQASASESSDLRRRLEEELKAQAESRIAAIQKETADRVAQMEAEVAGKIAAARAEAQAEFAPQIAAARLEAAAETERARGEADTLKARLADAERDRAAADQSSTARLTEAERARDAQVAAMEARIADMQRQHAAERASADAAAAVTGLQSGAASLERLLVGLKDIDAGRTLSDVLNALVVHSGRQAPRAAVLLMQGDRIRGWRTTGFAASLSDAVAIDFGESDGGIVTDASRTGMRASAPGGKPSDSKAPRFADLSADRQAVAIPLVVGAHVVAILYADAGREPGAKTPDGWGDAIEILVRHAARALEAVTLSKAATLSHSDAGAGNGSGDSDEDAAKRYAKLLVAEIKLYHQAAVDEGRAARDLGERLGPQIARARSMYQERIGSDVPARMTYFDQELVATLADGDPQLLGAARNGLRP